MAKKQDNISNIVNESKPIIITLDMKTSELNLENYLISINHSYEPRFRKSELEGYDENLNLDFNEHHGKENAMILHDKIVKYAKHQTGFEVNFYESNTETHWPGVCISIRTDKYEFKTIPLNDEIRKTKIRL